MASILAAILLLAPFAIAASAHERNVAFLWTTLGAQDAAQGATMPDGRVVTLAQAVEEAAERMNGRDVGELPTHPTLGPTDEMTAADIWVVSVGPGDCQWHVYGPGSPESYPLHASLWIYEADTAESYQSSDTLQVIDWTLKLYIGSNAPSHWWAFGNNDHYCIETAQGHFAFPFLDGVVRVAPGYAEG